MAVSTARIAAGASPFLNGPFGAIGFLSPAGGAARPAASGDGASGLPDQLVESRSITDRLSGLSGNGGGAGPLWVILLITITFFASAGALAREVRRSV